jgi:hypothetical protein
MRTDEAFLIALNALYDKLTGEVGRAGPYDLREARKVETAMKAFAFELGSLGYQITNRKITTTLGHFTVYSAAK